MSDDLARHIGYRLQGARVTRGLTQRALAEHLGVTSNQVARWERATNIPSVLIFPRLAALFGVSVQWLITGQEPTPKLRNRSGDDPG